MEVNGNIVSDDAEKAEAFNAYFVECSTLDETGAVLPDNYQYMTDSRLMSCETTELDVRKCLSSLDQNKAFGPDGISPRLLREGAFQLAPSLCRLFNLSLRMGKFPRLWKQANVIPLHKKNDKASVNNYRPVSLLSLVGKVMEKAVFNILFE